jgi:hypothetical protein
LAALLFCLPALAGAAGRQVTPQMRKDLTEKLTLQCLNQEADFARRGFSHAQSVAICKCAMQQVGALFNARTVDFMLKNGVMPPEMRRSAVSATQGCIRSITKQPAP